MPQPVPSSRLRPVVCGKFFRVGDKKFYIKGVTYGPFAPNCDKDPFPERGRAEQDFRLLRELGANLIRIYNVPPRWLLDMAEHHGIKVLIDIPWNKHLCFLDSSKLKEEAREAVRHAVQSCARHPAVFAYSVVNEISPDVVRWSGVDAVRDFIEELVAVAKEVDPECLCTFANYPPTEFLWPRTVDFYCVNVYLHQQRPFENYLARLQMIADTKPLLLGEVGIDSKAEGESTQSEILSWQVETSFRTGLAGAIVYSFTDDWYRGGMQIDGWTFGLTTRERKPKPAFFEVKKQFAAAPYFPLPRYPRVSVVVASYNGGRTLQACLDSLMRLNYPDYEVILVDDGSTDITRQLASLYKKIRYIYQPNMGLSVARNTGINASTGEVVAFTDSDCRADEDWIYYVIADLLKGAFIAMGGHNFLPPEDSAVAASVMVSPGGPAHVMLTDRVAEHIPGCNMVFYKWALDEIHGFDPIFRKAGDDVDVCWRLQQRGYRIGFSPAGFVWHYRRSTVRAYLKQQQGYGEAEALLVRRHPEYFNAFGGSIWHGRIYTPAKLGISFRQPIIYRGLFATGFFQTLYRSEPAFALMLCTTMEYHVIVNLPLLVISVPFRHLLSLAIGSILVSLSICVIAAFQAEIEPGKKRIWSRPLITLLFFLQPIARGWARYKGALSRRPTPQAAYDRLMAMAGKERPPRQDKLEYWAETWVDRLDFVKGILNRLDEQGWQSKMDAGWSDYDVEIYASRWVYTQLSTVAEPYAGGKQLIRCRLKASWSLPAKLAFFSMLGFELMVIGFVQDSLPQIWGLLITLLFFWWFIESEQRDSDHMITMLLDDVAKQCKLIRINTGKKSEPPANKS